MHPIARTRFLNREWDAEQLTALGDLWRDWYRLRFDRTLGPGTSQCQREYRLWGLAADRVQPTAERLAQALAASEVDVRADADDVITLTEGERGIFTRSRLGEWLTALAGLADEPLWLEVRLSARARQPLTDSYRLILSGELLPDGRFRLQAITTESGGMPTAMASFWSPEQIEDDLLAALATRDHVYRQIWITAGAAAESAGACYPFQAESVVEAQLLAAMIQQRGQGAFTVKVQGSELTTDLPLPLFAHLVAAVRHRVSLGLFMPNRRQRLLQRLGSGMAPPPDGASRRRALAIRLGIALLACGTAWWIGRSGAVVLGGTALGAAIALSYLLLRPLVMTVVIFRHVVRERERALDREPVVLERLSPGSDPLCRSLVARKHAADAAATGFRHAADLRLAADERIRSQLYASADGTTYYSLALQQEIGGRRWWPCACRLYLESRTTDGVKLVTLNRELLAIERPTLNPTRWRTVPGALTLARLARAHAELIAEATGGGSRLVAETPDEFLARQEREFAERQKWRRRRGYCTWWEAIATTFTWPKEPDTAR